MQHNGTVMGIVKTCVVHERKFTLICPYCYTEELQRQRGDGERARLLTDEEFAQRKHESTHGWRNPPSVYEEDR